MKLDATYEFGILGFTLNLGNLINNNYSKTIYYIKIIYISFVKTRGIKMYNVCIIKEWQV